MSDNCQKGVGYHTKYTSFAIKSSAQHSGQYQDLYFYGCFIPPKEGYYQLIFSGDTDYTYEPIHSIYSFNGIGSKSRSTAFHYLYENTCYKYSIVQAVSWGNHNGALYYKDIDGKQEILSSTNSLSCTTFICLKGSDHPTCIKKLTCKVKGCNNINIIMISNIIIL